ncbi:MAG TPA: type III pantothenate kinase, partial [Candidatus Diapherotrites archaeon]|nr:type III pantothenate kinase [Candidatus Diapherotrites archaeon]
MILVIDVGNTNIVLGIYSGKKLANFWRVKTDAEKTSDEYGMIINQLFELQGYKFSDIEAVVICSVVPPI